MVSAMNRLNELITQMDERCNKLPVDVTFDPQPGEMCCALFKGETFQHLHNCPERVAGFARSPGISLTLLQ